MTVETTKPKRLVPFDVVTKGVEFWTDEICAHIIEYDSVNKRTFHNEWQKEDDTKIDYKANLQSGLYNYGFAVRTGLLHRGPYTGWYLYCIDFDTFGAFQIWCGEDYTLDSLAAWTRVEWHNNPEKIHVFFLSKTPLKNLARFKENSIIEVYSEVAHLACVCGYHADGNLIQVHSSEKIAEIDNIKKLEIEARIKAVTGKDSYDDSVSTYVEELEKPETIVGKGSVHIAVRTMLMSVYFRWTDAFTPDKMSDNQRFQYVVDWDEKKASQAKRDAYFIANPAKMKQLWKDIQKKYQGQRQEERDKREEKAKGSNNLIWCKSLMPGCVVYEITPIKFIVGTVDNKIAEVTRKLRELKVNGVVELDYILEHTKTFTACKPVKIIKHINPLSSLELLDRYTIQFRGMEPSGCFTIKHKTIPEITSILKNGNVLSDNGVEIAIQAQIKGFEQEKILETNDNMDYTGFFYCDNKIIASNVEIQKEFPDVTDALSYIDDLQKWYNGREDLLAHSLLWFMIAPLSFIFKIIKAPLLTGVHLHGKPNAGKTSTGEIGLAFDGNERNEDYLINMNHIDSPARFGDTVHGTTFPKVIDEVDLSELCAIRS